MAHRFNWRTGMVEPKPSASARTMYRWRMRRGLDTPLDAKRYEEHKGVLTKIAEALFMKQQAQSEKYV